MSDFLEQAFAWITVPVLGRGRRDGEDATGGMPEKYI
jgi:hypothetical protein